MSSQPFLGASRRAAPSQGPGAGGQWLEGLIDFRATERERALREILKRIDRQGTSGSRAQRDAVRSANREMARRFKELQRTVKAEEVKRRQRNARALVKLGRIARAAAKRHPLSVAADIAIELAGRMPTPALPNYLPQFGVNANLTCAGNPTHPYDGCISAEVIAATQGCIQNQGVSGPACPAPPTLNPGASQAIGMFARFPFSGFWREDLLMRIPRIAPGVATRGVDHIKQPGFPPAGAQADPSGVPEYAQNPTEEEGPGARNEAGVGVGPRWPAMNPEALPINRPSQQPKPIPLRLLKERANMWSYAKGGLELSAFGNSAPDRDPMVEIAPEAGPTIEITPLAPPRRIPPEHKFEAPPRRTKEIKTAGSGTRLLMLGINAVTESKDFIEALYEGIDEDCKKKFMKKFRKETGHKSLLTHQKLQALYECAGPGFDMCKATKAIVENQVEDYVFGKTGQRLGKLAREWGPRKVRIGFQSGGSLGKTPKNTIEKGPDNKKPWDKWTDHIVKCE